MPKKFYPLKRLRVFLNWNVFILSKRFLGQPLAYSIKNFDWSSLYNLSLLREVSSSLLLISEKGLRDHGFIVGAFVDLLFSLADSNGSITCSDSTSYSSAVSSFASSPLSGQNEIVEHGIGNENDGAVTS